MAAPGPTTDLGLPAPRLAEKIGYLREIDIFRDLTPAEMDWLERTTTMFTCEKGQVIYTPGETGEVLFLLKRGRVQIYRLSTEGKKLVVATLEPGTFFGEMALVGQGMYEAFAEALEPSLICALSRNDVVTLLLEKPAVALRLIEVLGERLLNAQLALETLAFKPVPARLATILLHLRRVHGDVIEGISHQELADMAGTLRETTTQTLDEFKAMGWIETGRRRLVIRDAAALQAMADVSRQRPSVRP
jgi:CRP/FNR family cyclic AMP-dependent transcriptional regulator